MDIVRQELYNCIKTSKLVLNTKLWDIDSKLNKLLSPVAKRLYKGKAYSTVEEYNGKTGRETAFCRYFGKKLPILKKNVDPEHTTFEEIIPEFYVKIFAKVINRLASAGILGVDLNTGRATKKSPDVIGRTLLPASLLRVADTEDTVGVCVLSYFYTKHYENEFLNKFLGNHCFLNENEVPNDDWVFKGL